MKFEIISEITTIEIIAVGNSIRDLERLRKSYGKGRWRKMKGIATVRRDTGSVKIVELHWYEENSIGKREIRNSLSLNRGLPSASKTTATLRRWRNTRFTVFSPTQKPPKIVNFALWTSPAKTTYSRETGLCWLNCPNR